MLTVRRHRYNQFWINYQARLYLKDFIVSYFSIGEYFSQGTGLIEPVPSLGTWRCHYLFLRMDLKLSFHDLYDLEPFLCHAAKGTGCWGSSCGALGTSLLLTSFTLCALIYHHYVTLTSCLLSLFLSTGISGSGAAFSWCDYLPLPVSKLISLHFLSCPTQLVATEGCTSLTMVQLFPLKGCFFYSACQDLVHKELWRCKSELN